MIKTIIHNNIQLAIIIKNNYKKDGIEFFSCSSYYKIGCKYTQNFAGRES